MSLTSHESAIDQVITQLRTANGRKLTQRLQADEVRSYLGDLCSLLQCHFLDLPVQLVDFAMREGGTSRSELVDELIQMRVHPMIAA